jgi:hypothetical protein
MAGVTVARLDAPREVRHERPGVALAPLALAAILGWFMPGLLEDWLLSIVAQAR